MRLMQRIGPIAPGTDNFLGASTKHLLLVPVEEGSMPEEQSVKSAVSAASVTNFEPGCQK
jgi:hypothetical protein